MKNLGQKLKHELEELVPALVFFFVTFQLLALTTALMLKQYAISLPVFLNATVMALVVAKVVLMSDHLPLINRFPAKPLSYNVAWKTSIYFAGLLAFRYVEHLFHFWRLTRNLATASRRMRDEVVWPHFWALQIWLVVLLLMYCAFRELSRALGPHRVTKLFFEAHSKPGRETSPSQASL